MKIAATILSYDSPAEADGAPTGTQLLFLKQIFWYHFSGTYKMIDDEGVKKRCLPGCTSQSFTATLSESIYPYPHFIWDKKFCMVVKKLKKTCKSERKHTLGNNHLLVLFKFFFLCLWTKRALIFHYYFLINLKRFLRRFDQSFLKSLLYESNTKPLP